MSVHGDNRINQTQKAETASTEDDNGNDGEVPEVWPEFIQCLKIGAIPLLPQNVFEAANSGIVCIRERIVVYQLRMLLGLMDVDQYDLLFKALKATRCVIPEHVDLEIKKIILGREPTQEDEMVLEGILRVMSRNNTDKKKRRVSRGKIRQIAALTEAQVSGGNGESLNRGDSRKRKHPPRDKS